MIWIKFAVLAAILLYAGVKDIREREVPDFVSVMLLILGLVCIEIGDLPAMLVGAGVVLLPQLIVAMVTPQRMIGGADIKLSTAAAFLLGASRGLLALALGMILSIVIVPIRRKIKHQPNGTAFPLIPYLSVGILAAYIL